MGLRAELPALWEALNSGQNTLYRIWTIEFGMLGDNKNAAP